MLRSVDRTGLPTSPFKETTRPVNVPDDSKKTLSEFAKPTHPAFSHELKYFLKVRSVMGHH